MKGHFLLLYLCYDNLESENIIFLIINHTNLDIMKKLLLFTALSAFSIAGIAQSSLGLHIGGNLASATIKEDGSGVSISPDSKVGFLAGVVIEIPLATSFSFRPEINFIQKGYKVSYTESFSGITYSEEEEATMNYVEVPLNFAYNIPAGANQVFLGVGPTFGLGLSGKFKSKTSTTGEPSIEDESDINFGSDEAKDDFKPLDMGINILGGFKMSNGLFFKAAYNLGLSNLSHDSDASYKNKGFSFSIGYMFSKGDNFSKDY